MSVATHVTQLGQTQQGTCEVSIHQFQLKINTFNSTIFIMPAVKRWYNYLFANCSHAHKQQTSLLAIMRKHMIHGEGNAKRGGAHLKSPSWYLPKTCRMMVMTAMMGLTTQNWRVAWRRNCNSEWDIKKLWRRMWESVCTSDRQKQSVISPIPLMSSPAIFPPHKVWFFTLYVVYTNSVIVCI